MENIQFLEDRIGQLENSNSDSKIEANNLRAKLETEMVYQSRIIFERDNALQRLELAQHENESLNENLQVLIQKFNDEVYMHDVSKEVSFFA